MRKVIVFIFGIVFCVVITDIIVGFCCKFYVKNYRLVGRYEPLDRLIKQVDSDVLLIGNSIILNSIDPQIVEDSLSLSCYNGGIVGQGIEFSETIIDCILQRYTPSKIIIGLRPEEMGNSVGEGIYDILRPYYGLGYKSIDEHFEKASDSERILLHSNLYRYNTIWARIILYILFDKTTYSINGYMPHDIPPTLPDLRYIECCEQPSENKIECLERVINKCKNRGIALYVCFPPTFLAFPQNPVPCVKRVNEVCIKNNVPCLIYYNDIEFLNNPRLFFDNIHVNNEGASLFTKKIVKNLKYE